MHQPTRGVTSVKEHGGSVVGRHRHGQKVKVVKMGGGSRSHSVHPLSLSMCLCLRLRHMAAGVLHDARSGHTRCVQRSVQAAVCSGVQSVCGQAASQPVSQVGTSR